MKITVKWHIFLVELCQNREELLAALKLITAAENEVMNCVPISLSFISSEMLYFCTVNPKACSLMVWWVVGSILHGVDPLSYFSFQLVLHDWCNKGCGMCYPVCGILCGGSRFPFSLSEWSLTICLTPYNRR